MRLFFPLKVLNTTHDSVMLSWLQIKKKKDRLKNTIIITGQRTYSQIALQNKYFIPNLTPLRLFFPLKVLNTTHDSVMLSWLQIKKKKKLKNTIIISVQRTYSQIALQNKYFIPSLTPLCLFFFSLRFWTLPTILWCCPGYLGSTGACPSISDFATDRRARPTTTTTRSMSRECTRSRCPGCNSTPNITSTSWVSTTWGTASTGASSSEPGLWVSLNN